MAMSEIAHMELKLIDNSYIILSWGFLDLHANLSTSGHFGHPYCLLFHILYDFVQSLNHACLRIFHFSPPPPPLFFFSSLNCFSGLSFKYSLRLFLPSLPVIRSKLVLLGSMLRFFG